MEIQRARPEDAAILRGIAEAAFAPYVRRIGRRPAPMDADMAAAIRDGAVRALSDIADTLGFIVLRDAPGALHVEAVAVAPERHGEGHGRRLLDYAEAAARRCGLTRLELYTDACMTENLSLCAALGWRETGRRVEDGFARVFFEKPVAPAPARSVREL